MNPYLTFQNQARVKVKILQGKVALSLDCLIDTGFSGGLALPELYQNKFKLEPLAFQEFELADGSIVVFMIHEIRVKYKTIVKTIPLIFTKSQDSLLGIEFLNGFRLLIDLKEKQASLD